MKIISYQELMQLPPTLPFKRGNLINTHKIDLPAWQNELVAVVGGQLAGEAFLMKVLDLSRPGMPAGIPAEPNLVAELTIFGHLYKLISQESPYLSDTSRLAVTEQYLTAAYLQPYRTRMAAEVSATVWKQLILALLFAQEQKVLLLPDIFSGASNPEKALLHRVIRNLRTIQQKTRTIIFYTRQPEETIFLADRIVVLEPGAAGSIGEVIPVFFQEPRNRNIISQLPAYRALRKYLRYLLTDALALEDQASFPILKLLY
jgi:hypothetical protein